MLDRLAGLGVLAFLLTACAAGEAAVGTSDERATGLCVAAYVAKRAIGEQCVAAAGGAGNPAACTEREIDRWSAQPGGLAAYPDRASCACAVAAVRDKFGGAGVRSLLETPLDPFKADPNNDAGKVERRNERKTAVLALARACEVPAI